MFAFKESFEGVDGRLWSIKQFALEDSLQGPNVYMCEGYQSLLHRIGEPFLQNKNKFIRLNCKVNLVDYSGNGKLKRILERMGISFFGIQKNSHHCPFLFISFSFSIPSLVHIELETSSIQVHTTQGTFSSPYVVTTFPLGVLHKSAASLFTPPLPSLKTEAISNLSFGLLNKVILTFDKVFWPSESHWLWSFLKIEPEVMTLALGHPSSNEAGIWMLGILSLWSLNGSPTLVGFMYGDLARYVEREKESQVSSMMLNQLKAMFPESGLKESNLKKIIVTKWESDEFARGSYSVILFFFPLVIVLYFRLMNSILTYHPSLFCPFFMNTFFRQLIFWCVTSSQHIQVGPTEQKDLDNMARPTLSQGQPKLLWAGEHTHTQGHFSTVHGAYGSGIREGQRLVDLLKSKSNKL